MSLAQQRFLAVIILLALVTVLLLAFAMFEGHLMNGMWHSLANGGTDIIYPHP